MAAEENDLRSTLEEAFDAAEKQEGRQATDTPEPVRSTEEAPATGGDTETESARAARDERGRFARGKVQDDVGGAAGDKPAADAAGGAPAAEAQKPVTPVDEFAKAPQSWKPGAREAWTHLPAEVRAEVHRREREAAHVMQETATARQVYDYLGSLQQKYSASLAAENVDVLTATENLMGVATRLRLGTPFEKVQTAAQILTSYGVDLQALDMYLSNNMPQAGQMPPQQAQGQRMMQDPRVDQLFARLEQAQRSRIEQVQEKAVSEVESFGKDKDFFEDVREDMADLLELAAKRGLDLSLNDAYDRACQMNPEIRKVVAARAAAQQAGTAQQSTQRAKAAASSVRGTPSGLSTSAQPDTLRAAIEAAIDDSSGR